MIKFLFAGAHLILLAWMAMMGVESPKVQQVLPLHLELNESSVVKVTIQKSKLQGFEWSPSRSEGDHSKK